MIKKRKTITQNATKKTWNVKRATRTANVNIPRKQITYDEKARHLGAGLFDFSYQVGLFRSITIKEGSTR